MREKILDFIRFRCEIVSNRSKSDGINHWVITAGFIYLTWQSIPLLNSVRQSGEGWGYVLCFAQIQSLAISVRIITSWTQSNVGLTTLDYRIRGNDSYFSGAQAWVYNGLVVAPLAFAAYAAAQNASGLSLTALYTIKATAYSYFAELVLFAVAMVAMIASNQLSGYPLIAEVTQKPNKRYKFFLVLFLLLQAAFGLVNVYVFAEHFLSSTSPHVTESTILAFNTMLVIWGTYYLQRLKDRTSEISKLERLYRDVAIHNIEDEDAIARLNEELLGYQFGDWLEQKLAQVRQCADELKNKLEEMKPLLEGILALDKDLRFEVKGRLDAYKKGLNAKYDSYIKVFAALGNWLEISKRAANDEYIVDALAKTIAGLVAIHSQLLHQKDKTIELIDSTSAHANNEVNKLEAFEKTSLPMGNSKKNDAT